MLRWTFAPLPVLLLAPLLSAQDMSFSGGSLSVAPGTNVVLNGLLVWQLSADAVVVNDGYIELGEQAQLQESAGAPITGAGTEHALLPLSGPLVTAEPGGLGLTLSSALSTGAVSVTRGHLARTATNGAVGIGRWFSVVSDPGTSETLDLDLHYDLTELNGITPTLLEVFAAPTVDGTWTALASASDPPAQTVSASAQSPWGYYTAFDGDAANAVAAVDENDFVVWPSLLVDQVHVRPSGLPHVDQLDLFDATGRAIMRYHNSALGTVTIPAPEASGTYVLCVNGTWRYKLIKP